MLLSPISRCVHFLASSATSNREPTRVSEVLGYRQCYCTYGIPSSLFHTQLNPTNRRRPSLTHCTKDYRRHERWEDCWCLANDSAWGLLNAQPSGFLPNRQLPIESPVERELSMVDAPLLFYFPHKFPYQMTLALLPSSHTLQIKEASIKHSITSLTCHILSTFTAANLAASFTAFSWSLAFRTLQRLDVATHEDFKYLSSLLWEMSQSYRYSRVLGM